LNHKAGEGGVALGRKRSDLITVVLKHLFQGAVEGADERIVRQAASAAKVQSSSVLASYLAAMQQSGVFGPAALGRAARA
jgi:hypothetical protein